MSIKQQYEYTCDACGAVTAVERGRGGEYGWPKAWQYLESASFNLQHIYPACVTSFRAWLKQRKERAT